MTHTPPVERIASTVERLAVLVAGGVPPRAAWSYLEDAGSGDDAVATVVHAVAASRDPVGTLSDQGEAWAVLAATLSVSERCGAPVAASLRSLSGTLRDMGQTQRDVRSALAGPRSTSRVVMALPLVGLCFALVLGSNPIDILLSPLGLLCMAMGTSLMAIGWRWSSRMARNAIPEDASPGLFVDLAAIALSGGASVERGLAAVDTTIETLGSGRDRGAADEVIALAERAGVPAADLLRSEGARLRREVASEASQRAARLSTRLMIPLGLCVLPAFMLLGVAPMMIGILSSTQIGF